MPVNIDIDLAAERVIAAEKAGQKIAIEVKSFSGLSLMTAFHEALGQFIDYRIALREKEPDRRLYLAIPIDVYKAFFQKQFVQTVCEETQITLIVFDPGTEEILKWKN